jgi:hypothetical protein
MGDWTEANNNPEMCDRVSAEDVQRVASTYFANDQRNVLIINSNTSEEGEAPVDPRYAQALGMIESIEDPAQLEQMMGMFSSRLDQIEDPERKARMEKLLEIADERLKELKAAEKTKKETQ